MNSGTAQLAGTCWRGAGLEIQKIGCFAHHLESLSLGACRSMCHNKGRTASGRALSVRNTREEPQHHGPEDYLIQIKVTISFQILSPIKVCIKN